jgi:hypothetical protein
MRHVSDLLRDESNVTEGVMPRAEIAAAAQAIVLSPGTPLSSVDAQKQEGYRFAASAALHAAEIARAEYRGDS